jgi:aminoglycoside phosphotransferase (APT) family kinase protein
VNDAGFTDRLAALMGGGVTIADLKLISGGNARRAWSFDAVSQDSSVQPCVLLAQVAGKHVESDTAEEYRILRAMTGLKLCAPAALALDAEGVVTGGPALVLERIGGIAGAVDFLKLDAETGRMATEALAKAIARVHSFDWEKAGIVIPAKARTQSLHDERGEASKQLARLDPGIRRDDVKNAVLNEIELWETRFLAHRLESLPALAHLFRWLKAHLPAPSRLSLIHGDLRPGNFLFEGSKINALLDWEMAHIGDPAEDIAWAYRALWSPELFMSLAEFVQAHGMNIPLQNILFYRIFSEVKFATISVSAAASFARGNTVNLRHIDRAAKIPKCVRLCFHWIDSENWETARVAA